MNKIVIVKLPNGNFLISTPDGSVEYQQAFKIVTDVRLSLPLLKPLKEDPRRI